MRQLDLSKNSGKTRNKNLNANQIIEKIDKIKKSTLKQNQDLMSLYSGEENENQPEIQSFEIIEKQSDPIPK